MKFLKLAPKQGKKHKYRRATNTIKHTINYLFCKGLHMEKMIDNITIHELTFTKATYNKI